MALVTTQSPDFSVTRVGDAYFVGLTGVEGLSPVAHVGQSSEGALMPMWSSSPMGPHSEARGSWTLPLRAPPPPGTALLVNFTAGHQNITCADRLLVLCEGGFTNLLAYIDAGGNPVLPYSSGFSTALVDKAAAAELRADAVESSALSTKADMAALQALLADVTADAAGLRLEIRALTADNDRSLVTIGSLQGRLTGLQLQLDDTSVAAAPAVAAGLAAQAAPNRALLDCEQVITRLRGDLAAALRARAEQAKLASEVRACLGAVEAQYEDLRVDAAATLHEKDATIARLEATLLAALAAHKAEAALLSASLADKGEAVASLTGLVSEATAAKLADDAQKAMVSVDLDAAKAKLFILTGEAAQLAQGLGAAQGAADEARALLVKTKNATSDEVIEGAIQAGIVVRADVVTASLLGCVSACHASEVSRDAAHKTELASITVALEASEAARADTVAAVTQLAIDLPALRTRLLASEDSLAGAQLALVASRRAQESLTSSHAREVAQLRCGVAAAEIRAREADALRNLVLAGRSDAAAASGPGGGGVPRAFTPTRALLHAASFVGSHAGAASPRGMLARASSFPLTPASFEANAALSSPANACAAVAPPDAALDEALQMFISRIFAESGGENAASGSRSDDPASSEEAADSAGAVTQHPAVAAPSIVTSGSSAQ